MISKPYLKLIYLTIILMTFLLNDVNSYTINIEEMIYPKQNVRYFMTIKSFWNFLKLVYFIDR